MLIPILQNRGDRIFWRKGTMIAREMLTIKQDIVSEWARGVQAIDWWNAVLDTRPIDERIKERRAKAKIIQLQRIMERKRNDSTRSSQTGR